MYPPPQNFEYGHVSANKNNRRPSDDYHVPLTLRAVLEMKYRIKLLKEKYCRFQSVQYCKTP